MPMFPKLGKPDTNLLEQYVFSRPNSGKRAERLAESQKARKRRAEIKQLKSQKKTDRA